VQRFRQAEESWLRNGQTTTLFSSLTENDPVSGAAREGGIAASMKGESFVAQQWCARSRKLVTKSYPRARKDWEDRSRHSWSSLSNYSRLRKLSIEVLLLRIDGSCSWWWGKLEAGAGALFEDSRWALNNALEIEKNQLWCFTALKAELCRHGERMNGQITALNRAWDEEPDVLESPMTYRMDGFCALQSEFADRTMRLNHS
jgi:hypothetical protein